MRDALARAALACAILALGACAPWARPADDARAYTDAARALGAATADDACPMSAAELTERTIAAKKADPRADPYAASWACVAITDDLARDAMGSCAPPHAAVVDAPLSFARRVTGHLWYLGLDPREYAYDLVGRPGGIDVEVRVELTGPLARDPARVARMQRKMDEAALLWTRYAPHGRVRFRFLAVTTSDASPHFQVRLAPGDARTPFDVTWGEEWPSHLLAHEIGHMMGLDDEYEQLRKTLGHALGEEKRWTAEPIEKVRWFHCDPASLMCDSKGEASVPLPYHYYVILRRRFCRVTPARDVFAP